jgi:hypothetical protein
MATVAHHRGKGLLLTDVDVANGILWCCLVAHSPKIRPSPREMSR